jgi:MYXO-CTERM domain-containing protein
MKILLDTCTFLWLAADDPALSAEVRDACSDPTNEVYLSAISAWEIAIKHRLGRLPLPEPPTVYVSSRRQWLRLEACPFDERSAAHTSVLPDTACPPPPVCDDGDNGAWPAFPGSADADADATSGCVCQLRGGGSTASPWWLAAVALALARRRRNTC